MKKVAVIHTTPVTIPTLKKLLTENRRPDEEEIEVINFLDDSMLPEINRLGHPSEGVKYRLNTLLLLCQTTGADAVLCACSSIGGLVEEGSSLVGIPVFRIDEPMARLAAGYSRIGVAATLHSTIMPTTELIRRKAVMVGNEISIRSTVIENVGNLLAENKGDLYDEMVGEQLRLLLEENEVVVLAQASMARAVEKWPEEEKSRCLTSPVSGVEAVRDYLRKKEG
ncbi:hypothetical protein HMPREF0994_01246 [Lachnospiraceae bacterium 3_1_57FAA_CT1]|nr:hypothetical protein HMPREF0994_01246 [Lachnospiraceae bacterium 3_1_57FAA_CT1]